MLTSWKQEQFNSNNNISAVFLKKGRCDTVLCNLDNVVFSIICDRNIAAKDANQILK